MAHNEYKEGLNLNNPKSADILYDLIKDIVRKEISKAQFNRMIPAKVTSVGSGTANVELIADGTALQNVKNKTGQTLTVGQEVYIEFINNSSSNFYIAIAK